MTDQDRAAVLAALDVSRETAARLDRFVELLRKWTPAINLVSRSTLPEVWGRHILDSAQLLDHAPDAARRWVDLGSGAGFPGLVVAILAAERRRGLIVTLVESDLRKATFLQTAARECDISVEIRAERAEILTPQKADVVSARALAPLDQLLALAERHLATGGTAVFLKGAGHAAELANALERWRFTVQKHRSRTDPEGAVLCIGDIARA